MTTAYFHGGAPGRGCGDLLLPPDVTGVASLASFAHGLDTSHVRTDRVFLAADFEMAAMYAAMRSDDALVYDVIPLGPVEPDPDWSGPLGRSVQVDRAMVVRSRPISRPLRTWIRAHMLGQAE